MPAHVPIDFPADVNADWLAGISALGWRGIVLVMAGLLVLYVLLAFFRLRRMGRARAVGAGEAERGDAPLVAAPPHSPGAEAWSAAKASMAELDDLPWARSPPVDPDRRRLEIVEGEVVAMRGQIEGLREAIDSLAAELRAEIGRSTVALPDNVTPIYGDAMRMAMGGFDVTAISERCGIARAEAELVVALARQSRQGEQGERDGGQDRY